jgi:flagellar biosynthesis protein FliP
MKIRLGLLLLTFSLLPVLLYGQTGPGSLEIASGGEPPSLITSMAILAAMALLPFAVMMLTSFLKIVVVLSLMRNALGVQQSPPNQAINGIAILMTIYVMFPTANAMYSSVKDHLDTSPGSAPVSYTHLTLPTM